MDAGLTPDSTLAVPPPSGPPRRRCKPSGAGAKRRVRYGQRVSPEIHQLLAENGIEVTDDSFIMRSI